MSAPFTALFVYLRTTPLLGLAATLVAWQGAVVVSRRLPRFPLFNPMPLAILALVVVLLITGTPCTTRLMR